MTIDELRRRIDQLDERLVELLNERAQCALEIGRALRRGAKFALRMGVHSGPVNQIADVNGRLNLTGLVTHTIRPEGLGTAYEGLLKKKEEYLGVVVNWSA